MSLSNLVENSCITSENLLAPTCRMRQALICINAVISYFVIEYQ